MSEPTLDGLALNFEFVRSKKGSFYEETLISKKSIFCRTETTEFLTHSIYPFYPFLTLTPTLSVISGP